MDCLWGTSELVPLGVSCVCLSLFVTVSESVWSRSISQLFFLVSMLQSDCQEWCRYLQVPCSAPGVVQVPRSCPVRRQELCRKPAGALFGVRSGADTLQVPWPAVRSGAGTPAGALFGVRSGADTLASCQKWCRNLSTESLTQQFPGCVVRRLHPSAISQGKIP